MRARPTRRALELGFGYGTKSDQYRPLTNYFCGMGVEAFGPMPVIWMMTSPSLAHV
jgi:hypothetical protein